MSNLNRGSIQVALDGSGKKVFNLVGTTVNADGSEDQVFIQGVSLVDSEGNPVNLDDSEWKADVLSQLTSIVDILMSIANPSDKHSIEVIDRLDGKEI